VKNVCIESADYAKNALSMLARNDNISRDLHVFDRQNGNMTRRRLPDNASSRKDLDPAKIDFVPSFTRARVGLRAQPIINRNIAKRQSD